MLFLPLKDMFGQKWSTESGREIEKMITDRFFRASNRDASSDTCIYFIEALLTTDTPGKFLYSGVDIDFSKYIVF